MVDQNGENALARAYPVSDARDHRPGSATNGQGLPPGGRRRLKKLVQGRGRRLRKLKLASLNVGSGHVMRMEEDHVVKRVMTKAIPGKRKRGRPKTRWKDVCKRDMQTVGLREGDAGDRAYWKEMINNHSGDPR